MRIPFLIISLLTVTVLSTSAQEITEVNQKVENDLYATYHILKNKPDVKWGAYLLHTRKKHMAVAMGTYRDNKRTDSWRFFDNAGRLLQIYDFNSNALKYEAPESNNGSFHYIFDVPFTPNDTLTKAIRVGGRYFGYQPYLKLFIPPDWFRESDDQRVTIELLISPGGRLAEFNFHISGRVLSDMGMANTQDILRVKLSALSDEDKVFIPATKNGEPVASRIIIRPLVTSKDKLALPPQQ